MKPCTVVLTFLSCAVLAGCVIMPTAPTIAAQPGSQKSFEQYAADDAACREQAQMTVNGPGQAAANNAAANAAVSTAVGAAAGALIGGAAHDAGAGAAIGAGTGLLVGSAAGSNYAGYSSYHLQYAYDSAYLQCMYARGNRVPARFAYDARPRHYYSAPSYPPASYPPPNYPPPQGVAPGSTPPPAVVPSYPPPNTPPPRG
jgi:hypothetical protein